MGTLLIILSLVVFAVIAWRNLPVGLAIFFALLPTYLIRFQLGPLPTTFLEIMIWILCAVWLIQKIKAIGWRGAIAEKINCIKKWPALAVAISLFLIGATINVFLAIDVRAALGEWRAFYLEPILISYLVITTIKNKEQKNKILLGLILCGLVTALLAIYQHFTGWLVPHSFWANRDTYRVTAWYGFPNGVALFLAPLIPLAIHLLISAYKKNKIIIVAFAGAYIVAAPFAIVFAKSTGAIIGLLGGLGLYLLLNKKTRLASAVGVVVIILGIIFTPNSNSIKQEILARDRSGQLRRDIWSETISYLKIHPLRGTGMAAYSTEIVPFRRDKTIEVFHHPHNIFLTIWVNTGLVGLVGFVGILGWFFVTGLRAEQSRYILIAMTVIITMGLVDSPYIKNDLALVFWFMIALAYNEFSDNKKNLI
ncbi:MAG: hypothetical protein A2821_01715 [Candidatus Magasanikbacteria bacterium RIFCSPHIGHO2_01_FULL_41_23]|nr:MAG: hypothetical protein A2821_01715 [Candidatus Magasanikbacteria bacterium RIFCSPHIGHO2_01_FULL_41_23]OGH75041.1 MAG: hypothetical protein A3F22_00425 [Candidatus Magasanikbacteria bacterium RIFCSPHIGHO2_12_FULL_41_16]